ncbi:hypothetical protein SAMN04488107_2939 [Geodermatophilus saharensis]|uniref:Uncharacterized protein n=1 Tax=Geodermatophilus saharensis TaxID=1137994 RepID=A0A239FDN3_9ACTN|nr:hypothetical protein [Geodermatophilus saharensis]SNS54174.1 hypothetical protein SAMN04488107_2939 [Geodermatophilus saharensis]
MTPEPAVPAPPLTDVVVVLAGAGSPTPRVVAYRFGAGTRPAPRAGRARLLRRRAGAGRTAGRRVTC